MIGQHKLGKGRLRALKASTALVALVCAGGLHASEIDLCDQDFTLRWDNTLRYTLGERAQDASSKLMDDANASDGDRNFKSGVVTNRLDWFTEADIVYKK